MGAIDLNKVAIVMGKVIKLLSELEPLLYCGDDVYENKDNLCVYAYICRVGILDRIENNSYMLNPNLPVRIPTGIFTSRKETMTSALNITVGKLKEIASRDVLTENIIDEILSRRGAFYQYEKIIPDDFKRSL